MTINKHNLTIEDIIENYISKGENKPINFIGDNALYHFVEFYSYTRTTHCLPQDTRICFDGYGLINKEAYNLDMDMIDIDYLLPKKN